MMNGKSNKPRLRSVEARERVTAVVTSCQRQDLLELTLTSFFAVQTYRNFDMIVVEDGPEYRNVPLAAKFADRPIRWIATEDRVGQIRAIDFAYSQVTSPFIFHMEDDWEFFAGGFIEKSLEILRMRHDCLQVHIRAPSDLSHPLAPALEYAGNVPFRRLLPGHRTVGRLGRLYPSNWYGFSFNPGLRRLVEYRAVAPYAAHTGATHAEEKLGHLFCEKGFYAVVLVDNNGQGYTKHIGSDRHVKDTLKHRLRRYFGTADDLIRSAFR
jgi:glycosyltransferase involved in cell wall biosynthesis